jgi:hypothetical protein
MDYGCEEEFYEYYGRAEEFYEYCGQTEERNYQFWKE